MTESNEAVYHPAAHPLTAIVGLFRLDQYSLIGKEVPYPWLDAGFVTEVTRSDRQKVIVTAVPGEEH